MTFAIIQTGGKQEKVEVGDIIKIEKISGEFKQGDKIIFDTVVLVNDGKKVNTGAPFVEGAKVEAEFVEEGRNKKVSSLRFKNKTNQGMGVRRGHKQTYFKVKITKI